MANEGNFDQKRNFFRIEYPANERPNLCVGDKYFSVLDVSEEGLRFELPLDQTVKVGLRIKGSIDFCQRAKYSISGKIVRVGLNFAAIALETPLPLPLIMNEHRYLIKNFAKT
jgi:hypothetical protein